MRLARWATLILLVSFGAADVSAQSPIPAYSFVQDSSGQVWMIGKTARVAIPLYPATDDQITAVPWDGRWMVANAAGDGVGLGPKPDWVDGGTAPVLTAEEAITLKGERSQNTRPFPLRGGNYTARWETKLLGSASSCVAYAYLYRVEPKHQIDKILGGVSLSRDGNRSESGETQIYGVPAGQHYLDVNTSACAWSVTISPQ